MGHYEHCLCAMVRLLEAVGEKHWAAWIREDVHLWRTVSSTSHHLSAYGGMGSFNDVWICGANQHRVTASQEPWVDSLFEWLKSLCHSMARQPRETVTAASLLKTVGRHDAALTAFLGGDKADESMQGRFSGKMKLQGWRCLDCGHAEVSPRDIEYAIAQDIVPRMLFQACETKTLDKLVESILSLNIPDIEEARHEALLFTAGSGIKVHDRKGWMRPCPHCGNVNTAVYRWNLASSPQVRFTPAADNLPMRK